MAFIAQQIDTDINVFKGSMFSFYQYKNHK